MKKLLFLFLILSLFSCQERREKRSEAKTPIKVGVMTITSTESVNYKVYVGEVDASSSTIISAGHIGTLTSINVKQGATVKQGELLAEITSKNTIASYEMSQATLKQAEDGYERVKKVHESGTVADVKMIEIETQLAKARAAAKASEESMEECRLKAPFNGTISKIIAEEGVQVNPGTPILKLVDISTILIDIPVPEGEIGKLKIGQEALIDIPALDLCNLKAKIVSKGVTAEFPSHTYECRIAPLKQNPEILPGMVCKVRIHDIATIRSIIIPASSVEVDENGQYVWTVSNGKVEKTYVTVKGYQDKGVMISDGLDLGDSIIIQGAAKVSTGMSVVSVETRI